MNDKEKKFDEISLKLGYENEKLQIDPALLKFLSQDDLEEISCIIDKKKENAREENLKFVEEIYLKTKENNI